MLESLLGLVNAYSNHFHEGKEYFQDLDVFTQQLAIEIDALKSKTDTLDKQLEKRHNAVSDLDQSSIRIEGNFDFVKVPPLSLHFFWTPLLSHGRNGRVQETRMGKGS